MMIMISVPLLTVSSLTQVPDLRTLTHCLDLESALTVNVGAHSATSTALVKLHTLTLLSLVDRFYGELRVEATKTLVPPDLGQQRGHGVLLGLSCLVTSSQVLRTAPTIRCLLLQLRELGQSS